MMKGKRAGYFLKAFQAAVFVLACGACNVNTLNEWAIKQEPFSDIVTVQEMKGLRAVGLSWRNDRWADTYMVMRSIYDEDGFKEFLPIFRGEEKEHIDRDITIAVTYAYRLDKVKGEKVFEGGICAYYTRPEPTGGIITARGINDGRSAYLSWEEDENADKYILMKTEVLDSGVDFKNGYVTDKVELADVCSYIDNAIVPEKAYAYRLDKECGNQVFEGKEVTFFGKTRFDPFPGVITAQSLNGGLTAYLTWEADAGADEYRVMRAVIDGGFLQFMQRNGESGFVLLGATSAIDGVEDDKGYLYRLDKRRGTAWTVGLVITDFARTRPLPFGEAPAVESFRTGGDIMVNWRYDEGADSYILMRREDPPRFDFELVYTGNELHYLDTGVIDVQQQGRYVYKLYKRRNGIIYRWDEKLGFGVADRLQEDKQEPNDTEERATVLESDLQATLYCYGFSDPKYILEDIDWYKVAIPPKMDAYIAISYTNSANSEWLSLYVPDTDLKPIVHGVAFLVRNNDIVQKYVPFAIVPTREKFLGSPTGAGGSILGYNIKLEQMQ
jgi:hypothetical protein